MKTVIIYASVHHNNTKELVCAIAAENDIEVVDATKITDALKSLDLNNLNAQAIVDAYSETERFKGNTSSILEAKNERIRRLQTENVNLRNKLSQKEEQKESVKNVLS